jgi:predicted transcriptional regulator of viral defense system
LLNKLSTIPINQEKLLAYGIQMRNLALLKRIAFILEERNIRIYPYFLDEVKKLINAKYTLLDPGGPDTGSFNSRWMIRNNIG